MTPQRFLSHAILPAYELLPARMASPEASAMILAVCLQVSTFESRRSIVRYDPDGRPVYGQGRGYARFEMGGGVWEVLRNNATRAPIRDALAALDYDDDLYNSYLALEHNDILTAAYARLLLWSDPRPLPAFGQDASSWEYYRRLWRPVMSRPETWSEHFNRAWETVGPTEDTAET